MKDLEGKVAVVTGAADGIGLAIARRCAAAGMKVVLADITQDDLERESARLRDTGADALGVVTDVTDPASVEALASRTVAAYGGVHLVVNNAGVAGARGRFQELPLDSWRHTFDVNVFGVIHGVRAFLPLLLEQESAHIVNTASMSSLNGHPLGLAPYAASKYAVMGLTQNLFHELSVLTEGRVGVSVLVPGFTRTGMLARARTRLQEPAHDTVGGAGPFAVEAMDPEEVAEVVLDGVRESRFFLLPVPDEAMDMARQQVRWMSTDEPLEAHPALRTGRKAFP